MKVKIRMTKACRNCINCHGHMNIHETGEKPCCRLDILQNEVKHVREKRCPNFENTMSTNRSRK